MVTTHLGKFPEPKINNIRDVIFDEMMAYGALLNTEVLYYFLIDRIGVGKSNATAFALKAHYGGKKVSSRTLKEILIDNNYELEQRQVTQFVKRFLKSSRIEVLDVTPTTWQMNGFSTQERPYIAGFKRGDVETADVRPSETDVFVTLVNQRRQLKVDIQQKEEQIRKEFIPEVIMERNRLKAELDEITNKLLTIHN